ncbi:9079_t:CDS:2 [Cetraspora pellucida]|uniref:9079_t:CDS:1 n=1 Tax=Cetraspora pellucida TaxID=1433469 RepID=A0A9N9FQ39_9GLOM|nr:9079_t:CDS:2 [Cetraspora pellucida]
MVSWSHGSWIESWETISQIQPTTSTIMGVFDPTKPIYTSHENIEEFLIYFEAYATLKDWDNNKKSLVIVLHIADRLKPLIIQLRRNNLNWKNLREAMSPVQIVDEKGNWVVERGAGKFSVIQEVRKKRDMTFLDMGLYLQMQHKPKEIRI